MFDLYNVFLHIGIYCQYLNIGRFIIKIQESDFPFKIGNPVIIEPSFLKATITAKGPLPLDWGLYLYVIPQEEWVLDGREG